MRGIGVGVGVEGNGCVVHDLLGGGANACQGVEVSLDDFGVDRGIGGLDFVNHGLDLVEGATQYDDGRRRRMGETEDGVGTDGIGVWICDKDCRGAGYEQCME